MDGLNLSVGNQAFAENHVDGEVLAELTDAVLRTEFGATDAAERQQLLQEEGRRQAQLARAKAALPDNAADHARARKVAHRRRWRTTLRSWRRHFFCFQCYISTSTTR